MEWLAFLLGGGGAALAGRYLWDRRAGRRLEAAELEEIRKVADEDVTQFGEELSRLDLVIAGRELDVDTRHDYQRALDSYETAGRKVAHLRAADAISTVVDALAEGRYALACVRARSAGQPVPERRSPCFFNPQHGPSTLDIQWTPSLGRTRRVPACSQCAARVKAGDEPELRYVRYGAQRVPYWEAGALIEPYSLGYFGGSSIARAIVMERSMEMRGEGGGRWGNAPEKDNSKSPG
jgi:hypothetical protein